MSDKWKDILNISQLLLSLGEDLEREGLVETPNRVMRAWREFLEGYTLSAKEILSKTFDAESSGLQICKNIEFVSLCEHHLLAFSGVVHIGYVPNACVAGLSKLVRLVDCYSRRLQIQERMVQQIADAIQEHLEPESVLVIAKAKHLCCHGRGVRRGRLEFITTAQHGIVNEGLYRILLGSE